MELNERLRTRTRGHWTAAALLRAATVDGHAALGWDDTGVIEAGARADLTTVALDSVRTAGPLPRLGAETAVFAATAADVRHTVVAGRRRGARRGAHAGPRRARSPRAGDPGTARLTTHEHATHEDTMSATVITNIATLVTNDPSLRDTDPLGLVRDAAVVIEGDRVVWTGESSKAPATDNRVDAGGRAVLPGFVDSHSHLVFAGDRTEEFNARMSGRPYSAGGIRTTVAATAPRATRSWRRTSPATSRRHSGRAPRPSRPSPATD